MPHSRRLAGTAAQQLPHWLARELEETPRPCGEQDFLKARVTIFLVNVDDLRAFANRDWKAVEEAKRRYWVERKRTLSPSEALAIAEDLRQHVRALRPDWPSAAERAEDIEVHTRVSAALRSVR